MCVSVFIVGVFHVGVGLLCLCVCVLCVCMFVCTRMRRVWLRVLSSECICVRACVHACVRVGVCLCPSSVLFG